MKKVNKECPEKWDSSLLLLSYVYTTEIGAAPLYSPPSIMFLSYSQFSSGNCTVRATHIEQFTRAESHGNVCVKRMSFREHARLLIFLVPVPVHFFIPE